MEKRLTSRGITIGFIAEGSGSGGEQRVLDVNRQTVGYITPTGTYDMDRRKIADYSDPGMLLREE